MVVAGGASGARAYFGTRTQPLPLACDSPAPATSYPLLSGVLYHYGHAIDGWRCHGARLVLGVVARSPCPWGL